MVTFIKTSTMANEHIDTPIKYVAVNGKGCNGCVRHKKDVMVTITVAGPPSGTIFHDYFLTTEQASSLRDELDKVLKQNEEDGKDTNS